MGSTATTTPDRRPPLSAARKARARKITNLDELPVVLTVHEMAPLLRRGLGTIQRDCAAGTFRPKPDLKSPYRWYRDRVLDYIQHPPAPTPPPAIALQRNRRRRRG